MRHLPTGTVTLLFTDIEGSTRLLQELGRDRYVQALTDQRRLLREAFTRHGGVEVEMQGDSFHFAFAEAREAAGQHGLWQPGMAARCCSRRRHADSWLASSPMGSGSLAHTGSKT